MSKVMNGAVDFSNFGVRHSLFGVNRSLRSLFPSEIMFPLRSKLRFLESEVVHDRMGVNPFPSRGLAEF